MIVEDVVASPDTVARDTKTRSASSTLVLWRPGAAPSSLRRHPRGHACIAWLTRRDPGSHSARA